MTRRLLMPALLLTYLSGCGPNYSPDIYATNAVQQANKADQGVVVGVRNVAISASGAVGTVTGAAAGGIAGTQVGIGPVSAFSALGGSLVGGIAGSAVEHATADTTAFEYIVRKTNGDLVSVTQKDKQPLTLGQKVLVISGNQARVIPDYTVALPGAATKPPEPSNPDATSAENKPAVSPSDQKAPAIAASDTQPVNDALVAGAAVATKINEPSAPVMSPAITKSADTSGATTKPVDVKPSDAPTPPAATNSPASFPNPTP
ncbi:MAG TPA: hypothetical protein PLD10_16020 [Rhodopila sp.]|nr:hypothetical protein [Rhodopila sp.]